MNCLWRPRSGRRRVPTPRAVGTRDGDRRLPSALLRGAGRAGRLPKVTADQLAQVELALARGAEANGYPNDLWTLQRVAEVIERATGVAYHPARVWHILRERLGWSWQRPARRATERDDEAVAHWVKQRWPQLKKGHGARER
jgi:transposase